MLIVFAGPPCSGKTTLAVEIARRRSFPHLSMDATRRILLPDAEHTRADRIVAYRGMHFAAGLLLAAGQGVVLDGPYQQPEDREGLARLGVRKLIECRVSPDLAAARLIARGWPDPHRPDLTPDLVRRLAAAYPYQATGLILDTAELGTPECLARIEDFLG